MTWFTIKLLRLSVESVKWRRFCHVSMPKTFVYPAARRDDRVVDDYHGTKISDPYRWLEDPDSPETSKFIDAQNHLTHSYVRTHEARAGLMKRLTQLADYTKYYSPEKIGNFYVFRKNTGLQNQADLYLQDKLDSKPRLFLDINSLSEDGTTSLGGYCFSEDSSLLAYALNESGSDWSTIHFRNVLTGTDLQEVLKDVKFTCLSWTHDNKGIYYCRYLDVADATGTATASVEYQKLFYHQIGTLQSEDMQVVEFSQHPKFLLGHSQVSHCGKYLIVVATMRNSLIFIGDLTKGIKENSDFTQIVQELDAEYEYVTNYGDDFYFLTNKNAPNCRVIKINMNEPDEKKWTEIIAEDKKYVLESVILVNVDQILLTYIQDVKHVVQLRNLKSGEVVKKFPLDVGKVECVSGHRKHSEIFIKFVSFLVPGTIYHYDLKTMKQTIFHETKLKDFDSKSYVTNQIFFKSKDGTQIPMFIINRKDFVTDGTRPALMYGYGGFNISVMPSFSTYFLTFIEQFRASVAVVNLRGGGEYGQTWYDAGKLLNKQNCFDDFQAAGDYLITNKYTNKNKLVIQGGSNGGLLVGACINQRPDLFGVAIAAVGVMDMLRFHKFTIGYAWIPDYGSSDDKEQFEYLRKYSPLHNIKVPDGTKSQYPSTLLLTADHDDRVVPLHSLKYIATLQNTLRDTPKQKNPLMILVATKSGHGAGKPTSRQIEENVDILCFVVRSIKGLNCHCCEKEKSAPKTDPNTSAKNVAKIAGKNK